MKKERRNFLRSARKALAELEKEVLIRAEKLDGEVAKFSDEEYQQVRKTLPHTYVLLADSLRFMAKNAEKRRLKKRRKNAMTMGFRVNREGSA